MDKVDTYDGFEYFSRKEFNRPEEMSFVLLQMLDLARQFAGFPFIINSSYREGDKGSHGRGYAVDLRCLTSYERYMMIKSLIRVGFKRIGVYGNHIHVDVDPDSIQGVMWYGFYPEEEVEEHA